MSVPGTSLTLHRASIVLKRVSHLPSAGVPQVLLPQWFDCYDFASRAEWLGIGVYGNRAVAPHVEAEEFGRALIRATNTESIRCGRGSWQMLVPKQEAVRLLVGKLWKLLMLLIRRLHPTAGAKRLRTLERVFDCPQIYISEPDPRVIADSRFSF